MKLSAGRRSVDLAPGGTIHRVVEFRFEELSCRDGWLQP